MRTGSHQRLWIEAGIALACLFVAPVCGQYTISTVAGNGSLASCSSPEIGDGGPATAALLCSPYGVAVDSGGSLYIADTNHHRIRKVTLDGIISTVAGTGIADGCSGDGGPSTSTTLARPVGLALDGFGGLSVADCGRNWEGEPNHA